MKREENMIKNKLFWVLVIGIVLSLTACSVGTTEVAADYNPDMEVNLTSAQLLTETGTLKPEPTATLAVTEIVTSGSEPTRTPEPVETSTDNEKGLELIPYHDYPVLEGAISEDWTDMEYSLAGVKHRLGEPLSALYQHELTFYPYMYAGVDIANKQLAPNEEDNAVYFECASESSAMFYPEASIRNITNETTSIDNCAITRITYFTTTTIGFEKFPLVLAKGITWGDSMSDVINAYGEPNETVIGEDDSALFYVHGDLKMIIGFGPSGLWSASFTTSQFLKNENELTPTVAPTAMPEPTATPSLKPTEVPTSKPTTTTKPSSGSDATLEGSGNGDGVQDILAKENVTDFSITVTNDYCVFSWNLANADNKEVHVDYIMITDESGNSTVTSFSEKEYFFNEASWLCKDFSASDTYTYIFALNTKEAKTGTINFGKKTVTYDAIPKVLKENVIKLTINIGEWEQHEVDGYVIKGYSCMVSWILARPYNDEVYVEYMELIDESGNSVHYNTSKNSSGVGFNKESGVFTYNLVLNTGEHKTGILDFNSQTVIQDIIPRNVGKPLNLSRSTVTPKFTVTSVAKNGNEISLAYSDDGIKLSRDDLSEISSIVKNAGYPMSFVLYDINTGMGIAYNENRYYSSASTVKASFVYSCLQQISDGAFSMQDIITLQEKHMTSAGPSGLTRSSLGKSFTVENLIERTIRVSDNIGYITLLDYFGVEEYRNLLKSLENKVTVGGGVKWGTTSASDSLRLWLKIYDYLLAGEEYAEWFGSLLADTNKSFARDTLGDKYTIYNKMGWVYDQCCHEQALVMADNPYIVIVMTEGNVREENEKDMKALLTILDAIHTLLWSSLFVTL